MTMGCGDACPYVPGTRYEDWEVDDPAGMGVEAARRFARCELAARQNVANAAISPIYSGARMDY